MDLIKKNVVITDEAIQKLFKVSSIIALSEAIWNAIDAHAENIKIKFEMNQFEAIERIIIEDDGDGIPHNKFNEYFLQYQKSWKADTNNAYHGKKGEGRFKLMSIAKDVEWETCYVDNNKIFKKYSIIAKKKTPKSYEVSDEKSCIKKGTRVVLSNLEKKVQELNNNATMYNLIAIFALYLKIDTNLTITFNDEILVPDDFIYEETTGLLEYEIEGEKFDIKYIFIGWNDSFKFNDNKHTFFLDGDNNYVLERPSGIQGNFIKHSVFLSSNYFKLFDGLNEEWNNKIGKIIDLYKKELLEFLYGIRTKQSKIFYEKFQTNDKYYPFKRDKNDSEEHKALKDVFDVCAFKILEQDPKLLKNKNHSITMLFKLLKKLIEYEDDISSIIADVLELDEEATSKFIALLDSTSLPSLITHYEEVVRKLTFLDVLEELVHDEKYKKKLKERTQLHKIIEKEVWIFGSEFENKVGTSDKGLTAVITKNLKIHEVGLKEIEQVEKQFKKDKKEEPLLRLIPDLYMYNKFNVNDGKIVKNLIVELKAPSVKIGDTEIKQINDQRMGIQRNQRYKVADNNQWVFYVISSEIKPEVSTEFSGEDNDIIYDKDSNFIVYCKTWDEIIRKSKMSLSKQQEELNIEIKEARKENLLNKYLEEVGFEIKS